MPAPLVRKGMKMALKFLDLLKSGVKRLASFFGMETKEGKAPADGQRETYKE